MARRAHIDPRRPATRFRPPWRLPVAGPAHTAKQIGDIEMAPDGFYRRTVDGFERIDG